VDAVRRRLFLAPQRRLGLVAVPGVLLACDVTVEHRLVLELVTTETQAKVFFAQMIWQRTSKSADSNAFWNSRCQEEEWQRYMEAPGLTMLRYDRNVASRNCLNSALDIRSPLMVTRNPPSPESAVLERREPLGAL